MASSSSLQVLDKPRIVEEPGPLPSFNPFSPVKANHHKKSSSPSKGKAPAHSHFNPFLSPSKPKQILQTTKTQTVEYDSNMDVDRNDQDEQHEDADVEMENILRARKRLRGEPVSPSPVKPAPAKRARIQLFPPPPLEHIDDAEEEPPELDSCLIADSPIKMPKTENSKTFKLLFDEFVPTARNPSRMGLKKFASGGLGIFQTTPYLSGSDTDEYGDKPESRRSPIPRRQTLSVGTMSMKPTPQSVGNGLIPPSPPVLKGNGAVAKLKTKPKGKAPAKRRTRASNSDADDPSSTEPELPVRVLKASYVELEADELDVNDDDLLPARTKQRIRDNSPMPEDPPIAIDLPDHLQQVLSIPLHTDRELREDDVVKGLLTGRIHSGDTTWGEIWIAGEDTAQITDDLNKLDADAWESEHDGWIGEL